MISDLRMDWQIRLRLRIVRWGIFTWMLLQITAIHGAEKTENVGKWYAYDTLYVFSIKVPEHAALTSMKVQGKNKNGRFITVGSPRIQILPASVIGNEIVFTRSRLQIGKDIDRSQTAIELRLAFYEEGLTLYGYGSLTQTAKPALNYDLELLTESSYPLRKSDVTDTAKVVPPAKPKVENLPVKATQDSSRTPKPALVKNEPTKKPSQVAATPTVQPDKTNLTTKTDTCECNDDSVKTVKSAPPKNATKDSTGAGLSKTASKKPAANRQSKPDAKDKVTASSKAVKTRPKEPSKAPKGTIFDQGILNGIVLEASVASPYWVSKNLTTWYSSIDWRLSFTTPFYYYWGPVMIGFTLEVSSFDFENTFPEGGRFHGQAALGYFTGYWRGLNMELGGGSFTNTAGLVGGLSGKIIEGDHLYLSGGVRGVIIHDIQTIGLSQWAEGRLTVGYKF